MTRYYFDLRDEDGLVVDDEGMELPDIDAVEKEATHAMMDAAREALVRRVRPGETAIEVRDDAGHVMRARFNIAIEITRKN
jgi:hypothetical protein